MTVEDIVLNKIRYNLDTKSRKRYYIYNRMYLYAILFHIHEWSLNRIGMLFETDHATVLNALKKADYTQHWEEFQVHTALLQEQYYFIIPKYKNDRGPKSRNAEKTYHINLEVSKEKYINFLKSKDPELIYEAMWKLTLDKLNSKIKKATYSSED